MLTKLLSMLTVPRSWDTWLPTSQKHLSVRFHFAFSSNIDLLQKFIGKREEILGTSDRKHG